MLPASSSAPTGAERTSSSARATTVRGLVALHPGFRLDDLDDRGDGFPAADAEGGEAAAHPFVAQREEQGREHARPRSADGVAQGDGAPAHVHARGIERGEPRAGDGDARERFVDLPEIDVALLELELPQRV